MKKNILTVFIGFSILVLLISCKNETKKSDINEADKTVYASDVIPFFNDWNLVLGDGSNAGIANDFEHKDFFYTQSDDKTDWVVYKAPNAGDTHGTSNNCRTELAQLKKWYPATADDKLSATLKVMNVSTTGDARVAASYSVVVVRFIAQMDMKTNHLKYFIRNFLVILKVLCFGIMKLIQL